MKKIIQFVNNMKSATAAREISCMRNIMYDDYYNFYTDYLSL